MKTSLVARLALLAAGAFAAASAFAQVSVSIGVNQPGVYGRIELGEPPPPVALVRPQPVYLAPVGRGYAPPPPLYLYVPFAEQRDWRRYCRRYDACGRPVYFVREDWVRERYVHEHPGWDRDHPRGGERRDFRDDRGDRHGGDRGDRGDHGDRGRDHRDGDRRGGDR